MQRFSREQLVNYLLERCPSYVDVLITQTSNSLEDVKIYGLNTPRPLIEQQLTTFLTVTNEVKLTSIQRQWNMSKEEIISVLETLGFSPCYEFQCIYLKPEMGELGCDALLGRFHDELTLRHWLGDLKKIRADRCRDLTFRAEQVWEYRWFLECPQCYALRVIELDKLKTPYIWIKGKRQSIHPLYGEELYSKYDVNLRP